MNLTLWDYALLPALVFVPSVFFLVFLSTLRLKTNMKKRLFISQTIAGFLGFAGTFGLPFYEPLRFAYTLVPVAFFIVFFFGFLGCLLTNVNPFDVKTPLFAPKPQKKKQDVITLLVEEDKPFPQTLFEANKLVDLLLIKLGQPYQYFKQTQFANGEDTLEFPFIVTSPNGLFLIYPCNWSGEIEFTDSGAKKMYNLEHDSEDNSVTSVFREMFFKRLLDTIGLSKTPVKTIICATNPSAIVKGQPSKYVATDLAELMSELKKAPANGTISAANLFDIQNAIEINRIKK